MRTEDKIKDRVQKLLNQAKDREGTPEGEIFYAKAFEMMAAYGFEQRDLHQPDEGDTVDHRTYTFSGSYTDMQAKLLHAIGRALHCTGFTHRVYNSTRVETAVLFGLRRHLERVDMLYGMLLPVMMVGAQNVRASSWAESTVVMRRSFMAGFAASIEDRLSVAEHDAAAGDSEYGLMLIDDSAKADAAKDAYAAARGLFISSHATNRTLDPAAFYQGQDAGDRSDLGQTRVQARPALPF